MLPAHMGRARTILMGFGLALAVVGCGIVVLRWARIGIPAVGTADSGVVRAPRCLRDLECAQHQARALRDAARFEVAIDRGVLALAPAMAGAYARRDCVAADFFATKLAALDLNARELPQLPAERESMLAAHHGACDPVTTPPPRPVADADSLTLETTGCEGRCPRYTVTLRGDGTLEYEGRAFVREVGKRTGTIPRAEAGRLFALTDMLHVEAMKPMGTNIDDAYGAEVRVQRGTARSRARDGAMCFSAEGIESGHCFLVRQLEPLADRWVR